MCFGDRENGKVRPNFYGNRRTKIIIGNREHKITNFRWGGGGRGTRPFFSGNMGTFTPTTLGGPRECIVCLTHKSLTNIVLRPQGACAPLIPENNALISPNSS